MIILLLVFFISVVTTKPVTDQDAVIPITIIHINDFHARFEETNEKAGPCKAITGENNCIGGYARLVTMLKLLRTIYKEEHPMYFNAGDNFQGTPWYSKWRWNVTSHFLNMLPADAMAIGNHEFDHGVEGLLPFLNRSISDVLIANIDETSQKMLKNTTKPYTILERGKLRIGVIGLITRNVHEISNTGNLTVLDPVETAKKYVTELQKQGITIIILVTHVGLDTDREIAKKVNGIDVIVGGHSHTHLYTGKNVGPDTPADTYPVVIENNDGKKTLIVHTSGHAKYIGCLSVNLTPNGEVKSWSGNPIFLSNEIQQDTEIRKEIEKWKQEMGNLSTTIGYSTHEMPNDKCKLEECLLGSLITDSMVYAFNSKVDANGSPITLTAFTNAGSIRTSLVHGDITYSDLLTLSPFANTIDIIKVSGELILWALEHAVTKKEENVFRGFLQMSGARVEYNLTKAIGHRVSKAEILSPQTRQYEDVKGENEYFVVVNSFLRNGGDGYVMLKNATLVERGPIDIDILSDFIHFSSPISRKTEGSIKFLPVDISNDTKIIQTKKDSELVTKQEN